VEFEVLVGRILGALKGDNALIKCASTDPELAETARCGFPSLDTVSTSSGRLDGPLLSLARDDRDAILGISLPGQEFVAAVNISDGVVSPVGVELHFPLLMIVVLEWSQNDVMRVGAGLNASNELTMASVFEVVEVMFDKLRIEGHRVCRKRYEDIDAVRWRANGSLYRSR